MREDEEITQDANAIFGVVVVVSLIYCLFQGILIEGLLVWAFIILGPAFFGMLVNLTFEEDNYRRWIKKFVKASVMFFIIPFCNLIF